MPACVPYQPIPQAPCCCSAAAQRTFASTTDRTGSAALTTWAKETAICEKDTQALTWPMVWNRATWGRGGGQAVYPSENRQAGQQPVCVHHMTVVHLHTPAGFSQSQPAMLMIAAPPAHYSSQWATVLPPHYCASPARAP